jgi:transposase
MAKDLRKALKRATQAVTESSEGQLPVRTDSLPTSEVLSVVEPEVETTPKELKRKSGNFVELTITGSKGKKYTVVIPASYAHQIPKVWEWTPERYQIADDIGSGIPIKQVSESHGVHRSTIYAWLEHPEFKEHVDSMVMETGFANRRERVQQLSRLSDMLVTKIVNELGSIKLNEKSVGAILSTIGQYAKHLGQEKEEFVEATKVEQQTTLNGTLGVAQLNIDKVLDNKTVEERQALEEDFAKMGDDFIRNLTGGK